MVGLTGIPPRRFRSASSLRTASPVQYKGVAEARPHPTAAESAATRALPLQQRRRRSPDLLGYVRTVTGDAMFGRDRKEHLDHPYPGPHRSPAMLDPEFGVEKTLRPARFITLPDTEPLPPTRPSSLPAFLYRCKSVSREPRYSLDHTYRGRPAQNRSVRSPCNTGPP